MHSHKPPYFFVLYVFMYQLLRVKIILVLICVVLAELRRTESKWKTQNENVYVAIENLAQNLQEGKPVTLIWPRPPRYGPAHNLQ